MTTCEFTFRILGCGSSRSELKSPKNSSEKMFHLTRIQIEILNENKSSSSINRLSILIILSYTFFLVQSWCSGVGLATVPILGSCPFRYLLATA